MRDLLNRRTIENAIITGILSTLGSFPNLYYLSFIGLKERLIIRFSERFLPVVVLLHVWGIFFISFMCAAFGFAWSKKYGLGGLGSLIWLKENLLKILLIAITIAALLLSTFDRYFSISMPYLYPSNPIWILSISLKASLFNEVIRFGMMAWVARLTRNIYLANIIVSIFFVYIGLKSFRLLGLEMKWDYFGLFSLGCGLIFNLLLGYLYTRYGILSTIFLQFILSLRLFAIHASI